MAPTARRRLGSSDVAVPSLGLGTAAFGGLYAHVEVAETEAVVRRALAAGVTYLDTAPQYGHGTSERRVGRALAGLAGLDGLPADVVLSTKVGRLVVPRPGGTESAGEGIFVDAPPSDVVFDFSPAGLERSLEASLERLGVPRVDVVYLHDPDDHVEQALTEAFGVLRRWRAEGVVGAIGVGMNQSAVPTRFVRECDPDVVLLAGRWTLLDRSGGADLLPACAERGASVVVGGVFNSGVLADPRPGARFDYAPASPATIARARALSDACERRGVPLKAAALQFPLRHPAVACVLTGARSEGELSESLAMLDVEVPEALWAELDAIAERVGRPCPSRTRDRSVRSDDPVEYGATFSGLPTVDGWSRATQAVAPGDDEGGLSGLWPDVVPHSGPVRSVPASAGSEHGFAESRCRNTKVQVTVGRSTCTGKFSPCDAGCSCR